MSVSQVQSHRWSSALFLFALTVLMALPSGCRTREADAPAQQAMSVADIDARIKQVEQNPGMPASAKQQVIKSLQKQRDAAAKSVH